MPPGTKVKITVSTGRPAEKTGPFSAKFSCGTAFELSPNDVLYPKSCYVRTSNFKTTRERVKLDVQYDRKFIEVIFDKQSEAPKTPYNQFQLTFRARSTAPPGRTQAIIIARHGDETVKIPVTIAMLPPGQEPSAGNGIRPTAEVATGSAGEFCVWRYKSFGDPPNCFNIVRATCDNPRYSGKGKYELVGSGMTPLESATRASQLSPYKGDAYGCRAPAKKKTPPSDKEIALPNVIGMPVAQAMSAISGAGLRTQQPIQAALQPPPMRWSARSSARCRL